MKFHFNLIVEILAMNSLWEASKRTPLFSSPFLPVAQCESVGNDQLVANRNIAAASTGINSLIENSTENFD